MICPLLVCHSYLVSCIHFTCLTWMYSWELTAIRGLYVHLRTTLRLFRLCFLLYNCGGEYILLFSLVSYKSWNQSCQMCSKSKSVFELNLATVYPWPPFVVISKTQKLPSLREHRSLLDPIMSSLGAWYFPLRGQLLSLLFTPHKHSWRMQLLSGKPPLFWHSGVWLLVARRPSSQRFPCHLKCVFLCDAQGEAWTSCDLPLAAKGQGNLSTS